MTKVFGFGASIEAIDGAIFWPTGARAIQRFTDGTMSADVTGAPSCHFRPGLSVNV